MIRKGSSRKGQRRRRAVASASQDEGDHDFPLSSLEIPVKLDLSSAVAAKEIARIEAPATVEFSGLKRWHAGDEGSWGHEQPTIEHRRVWWSFAAAILVMFAAIAWVNQRQPSGDGINRSMHHRMIIVQENSEQSQGSELLSLLQNPYQKQQQAQALFRKFAAAKNRTEVLPLIRKSDHTDAMLEKNWKPWSSPPILDPTHQLQFDFDETDGRAFLTMSGKNADGSPFLAFFVVDGSDLKLDWEATMELGEARLSSLARFPTENPVSVRVLLAPSAYYLPSLPENEYESYQLTCLQDETVVWGYVRRDSPEHQQIRELLRQDVELMDQAQEVRATIRLRKTKDLSSQNRFFITEMLHKDWVMP